MDEGRLPSAPGSRASHEAPVCAGSSPKASIPSAEQIARTAADTISPDDFEPLVRRVSDDIYERLMRTVQDYLVDNAEWNISARIKAAEDARLHLWRSLCELNDAFGFQGADQAWRLFRLAELHTTEKRYKELLYNVATKFEDEPRHETALRYIREREAASGIEVAKSSIRTEECGSTEGESPAPQSGETP